MGGGGEGCKGRVVIATEDDSLTEDNEGIDEDEDKSLTVEELCER